MMIKKPPTPPNPLHNHVGGDKGICFSISQNMVHDSETYTIIVVLSSGIGFILMLAALRVQNPGPQEDRLLSAVDVHPGAAHLPQEVLDLLASSPSTAPSYRHVGSPVGGAPWPLGNRSTLSTSRVALLLRYSLLFTRANWTLLVTRVVLTFTLCALGQYHYLPAMVVTCIADPFGQAALDIFLITLRRQLPTWLRHALRCMFAVRCAASLAAYVWVRIRARRCLDDYAGSDPAGNPDLYTPSELLTSPWELAWVSLAETMRLIYLIKWIKLDGRKIADPARPTIIFAGGAERIVTGGV
jgi:hypothetical protein